jgi:hypothetical protein
MMLSSLFLSLSSSPSRPSGGSPRRRGSLRVKRGEARALWPRAGEEAVGVSRPSAAISSFGSMGESQQQHNPRTYTPRPHTTILTPLSLTEDLILLPSSPPLLLPHYPFPSLPLCIFCLALGRGTIRYEGHKQTGGLTVGHVNMMISFGESPRTLRQKVPAFRARPSTSQIAGEDARLGARSCYRGELWRRSSQQSYANGAGYIPALTQRGLCSCDCAHAGMETPPPAPLPSRRNLCLRTPKIRKTT